ILQGEILLSPWVVLHQDAPPQDLQARFTVKPHHVYLTDAENLWPHSISPNQHAVLDRAIVNFLMEYEFAAPLSLITLASQNPVFNHPSASTAASDHLQGQIERITSAQPDNFLALAKAAHLDPKTDFAGGNLRGTELNNLDFGSANLVGVNFRGAELCDCDLSAAQLQQANLRGADLSGAYLANANLRYSDLQRASLALANLADADLRGANLSQTNLSQTNLSHAAVSGAYFGENVGLSQEMAANLQERGGIFL
ncbi:MAG: pentapeptide repeat-containing protein, partial [Jaaginema sp. PMC 1079.18]|nr:pentapeptide repeat-containing protein [Jaaginema sp. PMC 1079.18]